MAHIRRLRSRLELSTPAIRGQWTSVAAARDSGRLNSKLTLIATPTLSASLSPNTMKFYTIFLTAYLIMFPVLFLDPRRPGEFFLTYRCCAFIERPPVYLPRLGKSCFI
jgi:hypothetical protein